MRVESSHEIPRFSALASMATEGPPPKPRESVSCRTNSRRGTTDEAPLSYPPVKAVRRALQILRVLNRFKIASISELHRETGLPKPTLVRMLETLMADGYVARDNMCGGYRVTCKVRELNAGYDGISKVIEASRPWAIDLTQRIKWPVGIGVLDGDSMAVQFWTGTISPWVHHSTLLGHRPNLLTSAMGRVWLAFCPDDERESLIDTIRQNRSDEFTPDAEAQFRKLLERIRELGYSTRAPMTEPKRNTTVAMPIRDGERVLATVTVSFFISAVPKSQIGERILTPFRETVAKIENTLSFMNVNERGGEAGRRQPSAEPLGA